MSNPNEHRHGQCKVIILSRKEAAHAAKGGQNGSNLHNDREMPFQPGEDDRTDDEIEDVESVRQ